MIGVKELRVIQLLLWRNWKVGMHHKFRCLLIFLLPMIVPLMYVLLGDSGHHTSLKNETRIPPQFLKEYSIFKDCSDRLGNYYDARGKKILFTPANAETRTLVRGMANILKQNLDRNLEIEEVIDEKELKRKIRESRSPGYRHSDETILTAIQFYNYDSDIQKELSYRLYVILPRKSFKFKYISIRSLLRDLTWSDNCQDEWHVLFQSALDYAFVKQRSSGTNLNIYAHRFPIPSRHSKYLSNSYDSTSIILTLCFTVSLILMVPLTVRKLVEDKNDKLAEYLNSCGVPQPLYWVASLVDVIVLIGLQILMCAFILSWQRISVLLHANHDFSGKSTTFDIWLFQSLNASNFLLFLVLLLHILQSSFFAYFISVFFKSPIAAMSTTILVWPLTVIIPLVINTINRDVYVDSWSLEMLSCIIPNSALYWILRCLKARDMLHPEQTDMTSIFEPGRWGDDFAIFHALFAMVASILLYGLLIWYFGQVSSAQGTQERPWLFPILEIYRRLTEKIPSAIPTSNSVPSASLSIANVSKNFSYKFKTKPVLQNVNFKVEKNNLTVLAGPNGAGKTTLVKIISGLLVPNDGKVLINGVDVSVEPGKAQAFLGICPQHNIFFKYLTVRENLELMHEIKCLLRNANDGYSVEMVMKHLGLYEHSDKLAQFLSAGHLRQLTLGMALVGPGSILILDEPTEGVDPLGTQKIWDALLSCRKEKTILIASHRFEEINALADRVVILAAGQVKSIETLNSLKKIMDSGYVLKLKRNTEYLTKEKIQATVERHLSKSETKSTEEDEYLVYHIPKMYTKNLAPLLKELEEQSHSLGIDSIEINVTTLEDAYFKVVENCSSDSETEKIDIDFDTEDTMPNGDNTTLSGANIQLSAHHHLSQISAMFMKNFHYSRRSYSLLFTLILLPVVAILLMLVLPGSIHRLFFWTDVVLNVTSKNVYGHNVKAFIQSNDNDFILKYMHVANADDVHVEAFDDTSVDPQNWLVKFAEIDLTEYFFKFLYGVSFKKLPSGAINATLWYNGMATQSLLISQNLISNALLKYVTKNDAYKIKAEMQSMDYDEEETTMEHLSTNTISFAYYQDTIITILIFAISSSTFILRPLVEKRTGFKHLMHTTSMKPIYYWLANWMFDLTLYAILALIYSLLYLVYDFETVFASGLRLSTSLLSVYLVFIFYGWAIIPFAYSLSYMFKRPSSGFVFMAFVTAFLGMWFFVLVPALAFGGFQRFELVFLLFVLFPFPFFVFPLSLANVHRGIRLNSYCNQLNSLRSLATVCRKNEEYRNICCKSLCVSANNNNCQRFYDSVNPLYIPNDDGLQPANGLAIMFVAGLFYFGVTLLREYYSPKKRIGIWLKALWLKVWCPKEKGNVSTTEKEVVEEADVANQVVEQQHFHDVGLVVRDLEKFKGGKKVLDKLSFTVRKNECFGIVGRNGSGKTILMRILSHVSTPNRGNAHLESQISLSDNDSTYFTKIGYCPQEDNLLDRLTGLETLNLFMQLRPKSTIHEMQRLIKKLGLSKVINQPVSTYSGGTKRKLSLAVALIGGQPLILLDEPTTGVDPDTKKKIKEIIIGVTEQNNSSILFTTSSLNEIALFSSRIAVLSNGNFKSLSSLWQLQEEYNKGWEVTINVDRHAYTDQERLRSIKESFNTHFNITEINLKSEKFGSLHYHLGEDLPLSSVFYKMEQMKEEFGLEDYFISSSSFHHVLQLIMNE